MPTERSSDYRAAASEGQRRSELAAMTLEEIAELFGVTLQSVQAIEKSALAKLRRHPAMRELARELSLLE